MKKIAPWIEAMRLRTLPVSLAGIMMALGYARFYGCLNGTVALLCFLFALLAQISSNFANEYYDFKAGLDKAGRDGPRRGVTEGDITPHAMLIATFATLAAACVAGCLLLLYGSWWLIPAGIGIALGVLAYSTGPYPLSRHGLGEVAVMLFFGIVPVNLTFYIMAGHFCHDVFMGSLSAGLMGANVLMVNNYRDASDDRDVGKCTLAVILGRPAIRILYAASGLLAVVLMSGIWLQLPHICLTIPAVYLLIHLALCHMLWRRTGRALNPVLGLTATAMALYCIAFAFVA
ncbi:MAG: 1,4-dihydroxy-2-naphthoate octaprenyltransferase [Muribaculaceae bacterium]|nr:1,4-dihydroxy-2-naphthoate octaprenyltransferase [Muribaculaceae bacterium]